jgi:hypothetical protein
MSLDPSKLAELETAFNAGAISATDYAAAMGKAAKDLTASSNKFGSAFLQAGTQLGAGLTGLATAMANGQQGASAFNGVINSSSAALGTMLKELGPLGTAFGKLTEFAGEYLVRANQQGDALFKSFQDLSRVGGASAEGMTGVFENMQQFGLTMNQLPEFGAMIAQNSAALAMLGGTVTKGAKQFAEVASGIQQSGLQSEFMRMGLTTKNINEGTANYLRIQAMTAANSVKTTEQLTAGAAEYISQQDRLSRLTGKSADILAKEQEERMADQRFRAYTREQTQKEADLRAIGTEESIAQADAIKAQEKETKLLLGSLTGGMRKAAQDMIAGGTIAGSKEAEQMMKLMPEMSQKLMSGTFKASEDLQKGADEAGKQLNQFSGLAKVGQFDQVFGKFNEVADFEAKQLALRKTGVDAADKEKAKIAEGGNVDINNQVAMRQAQTATTLAMDNLVQKGVGPVTAGMAKLAIGIEKVITTIPPQYIGEKTSTRDTGRGTATPAVAGYGTSVKPADFQKFLEDSVANAIKALNNVGKEPTTFTEKMDVLKGKNTTPIVESSAGDSTAMQKLAALRTPVPKSDTSQTEKPVTPQAPKSAAPQVIRPVVNVEPVIPTPVVNIVPKQEPLAGPNTKYRTSLDDTRPEPPKTETTTQSATGASPELTQGLMELARNIGLQTSSINELVDLMRRSNGIQDRILQQSRN